MNDSLFQEATLEEISAFLKQFTEAQIAKVFRTLGCEVRASSFKLRGGMPPIIAWHIMKDRDI